MQEFNTDKLCEALYVVNKAAKKCRDKANSCFTEKKYNQSRRNSDKKRKLYDLKEKVIDYMIKDDVLTLTGYQIQRFSVIDKITTLSCYICSGPEQTKCLNCIKNNLPKKELKEGNKTTSTILLFYTYKTFKFHVPSNSIPENTEFLGILPVVSSKKEFLPDVDENEAIQFLEAYLDFQKGVKKVC